LLKERLRQISLTLLNLSAFVARRAAELALRDPRTTRVAVGGFLVWTGLRFGFEVSEGTQIVVLWLTLTAASYYAADSRRGRT
jgi:hypothetical protein